MSLKENGEQLLAKALADAMDRDLADVPSREQLEGQHRFSRKFVRRMRRLEADFLSLGAKAKRYSGLAAAFVCVVGLVAVVGVMSQSFRMGKSFEDESAAESAADTAAPEFAADDAFEESVTENADDAMVDEAWEEETQEDTEALAPDWQEQLLIESEKADELVNWHFNIRYDDGSIGLSSERADLSEDGSITNKQTLYVSGVFEVYYEKRPDEWECIYRTKRTRENYTDAGAWDEWYALEDLHMTQAGNYRLVRQINSYRQVLQLHLEER